jgi:antitoxin component HigA of HigAB toxin-antitoxin module
MTPSPQLAQAIAAGLRNQMVLHGRTVKELQAALGLSIEETSDVYVGAQIMTLNHVGRVAAWLQINPHELLDDAYGRVLA